MMEHQFALAGAHGGRQAREVDPAQGQIQNPGNLPPGLAVLLGEAGA